MELYFFKRRRMEWHESGISIQKCSSNIGFFHLPQNLWLCVSRFELIYMNIEKPKVIYVPCSCIQLYVGNDGLVMQKKLFYESLSI